MVKLMGFALSGDTWYPRGLVPTFVYIGFQLFLNSTKF